MRLHVTSYMLPAHLHRSLRAKEELQQQLDPRYLDVHRHLQPLMQPLASLIGQRIEMRVRPSLRALGFLPPQPRRGKPLQTWIDLPVTLAPEVSDRPGDR